MLLRVDHISKSFRGLRAVDQASFEVAAGTVHAIIGPNGAGKTTLFNIISGLYPQDEGTLHLGEADITRAPPHRRAELGIGRTFQNIRIFGEMSVLENVMTGMHPRLSAAWWRVLLRLPAARVEERRCHDRALELLAFVGLTDHLDRPAADLAYGDQRRLEIARALAGNPRLLLLDEPAAGMNPTETADLLRLIQAMKAKGLTVLLVEHDMGFVMQVSDRITVLNFGRKIAEGTPAEVRGDAQVIEAYLGKKVAERLMRERGND